VLKETDFNIDHQFLYFRKDRYPLAKINDVRLKKMSLLDNVGQLAFWLFLFAGPLWLGMANWQPAPLWLKCTAAALAVAGVMFGLSRCSRYALQVEFNHIDETGAQWVNVTKSYTTQDSALLLRQERAIKTAL